MLARVPADKLKSAILNILGSSRSAGIIISLRGEYLYVASTGALVVERRIKCDAIMDSSSPVHSIEVNQMVTLFSGTGNFLVETRGERLCLTQNSFTYNPIQIYDEGVDMESYGLTPTKPFPVSAINNIVKDSKALDTVAKALQNGKAPIIFHNDMAFMCYSNTVYFTAFKFEECTISSDILRKMSNSIGSVNNPVYALDIAKEMLIANINSDERVLFPVKRSNAASADSAISMLNKLKAVATINMTEYKSLLDGIIKTKEKASIHIGVHERSLSFIISGADSQFVFEGKGEELFGFKITIPQLSAIAALFGDSTNVNLLKGDNCICMKQMSKHLLMSSMIY